MKKTYTLKAEVDQIVTRSVELLIEAESPAEAEEKARFALQDYPDPVDDRSVKRIVVMKQHYWIPKSIEFGRTREEKQVG